MELDNFISDSQISLTSLLRSCIYLHSDAMMIYDHTKSVFLSENYRLSALQDLINDGGGLNNILFKNYKINFGELISYCSWSTSDSKTDKKLIINVLAEKTSSTYILCQVVPLHQDNAKENTSLPRFFICSLLISLRAESSISLIDRTSGYIWHYDFHQKSFIKSKKEALSEKELEVIKLSELGLSEKKISLLMHKSRDTIRYYKRNLFEKLGVHSIKEAVSFCRHFQII